MPFDGLKNNFVHLFNELVLYQVFGNTSILERTWMVIAILGLIIHTIGLFDGIGDLRYLHKFGFNGLRKMTVKGNIRAHVLRIGFKLGFLIIGLAAANTRPTTPQRATFSAVLGVIVTLMTLALLTDSWLDHQERKKRIAYTLRIRSGDLPLTELEDIRTMRKGKP
jgi:hypothetical protein